jgi:hypothetical protein
MTMNLAYGLSGACSEEGGGFGADCAVGDAGLGVADFPVIKYLRIFSRRFGPSPRIASKSSTLLNGPYDLRIFNILSAVAGPIPGTSCNCSDVAVFRFTGCVSGFFLAASSQKKWKHEASNENEESIEKTREDHYRDIMPPVDI